MSDATAPDYCLSCQDDLEDELSVIADLCLTCVARIGQDAIDELHDTAGAVCGDAFQLDREMLHLAHISGDATDAKPGLDLDDVWQGSIWHRLRLLWVLAAEVDHLRCKLTQTAPARATKADHSSGPADCCAARTRPDEAEADLRAAHGGTQLDLQVADARADHLAAIARRGLLAQHASPAHTGPIDTCRECRADWAVATAVVAR
jgi:hypothetical protein